MAQEKTTKEETTKAEASNKLYLKNVKVVFANLVDEGFGRSITVNATDPEVATAIEDWVSANNIGKAPNQGKANFKTYEDTIQYAFKLNDNTKFVYSGGVSDKDLGYGAVVSLAANAFDYDNKFGKGTSSSLSAVVVHKGKSTGADEDLAELLGDIDTDIAQGEDVTAEGTPF